MKALVNELSPINCLPPEVLSAIPTYWVADSQGDMIRATHVCRYWRTTLIGSPGLWNNVKSGNEARMRAYIHRSQSYPLSVEIKHPGQENILSDAVFFRMRALTLNLPMANLTRHLRRLASPTPMLEDLSITAADSPEYPPVLEAGDFFVLSRLHLDGVSLNFLYLPIPRLRVLHLENLENNIRTPDFLQFLERTPWLEELSLVNAGPRGGREPPERVVSLRSLRNLTLQGPVIKSKLLQHLALPASADIHLTGRFNQRRHGLMEDFLPPCLDNLPVTTNFTSLSITSTSWSSCDMQFSGRDGKLRVTVKNADPRGILIHGHLEPPTANLCLQRLTPLVLDAVTRLTLRSGTSGQQTFPETSGLREFLRQFPSLQSIDLIYCDFNGVRALHPVGVDLPSFHSLTVYVAPETKIDLDLLSQVAKTKSLFHSPLKQVKFVFGSATRVMFTDSEMDHLRENIQLVEVEEVDDGNVPCVL